MLFFYSTFFLFSFPRFDHKKPKVSYYWKEALGVLRPPTLREASPSPTEGGGEKIFFFLKKLINKTLKFYLFFQ
jgi:hypothetical protein